MKDPVAQQVLNCLIFDEDLETLFLEVQASQHIIKDVLKTLIVKEHVIPLIYSELDKKFVKTAYCDMDNLYAYRFRATARGIDSL